MGAESFSTYLYHTERAEPENSARRRALYILEAGAIDIDESQVYTFPAGLPAFEQHTRFALLEPPGLSPFVFLQSLLEPGLRFICAPVAVIDARCQYSLSEEEDAALGATAGAELIFLAILTFPPAGTPTANLLAPVVLNRTAMLGVQSIQSAARYSHCHPLGRGSGQAEGEPSCS